MAERAAGTCKTTRIGGTTVQGHGQFQTCVSVLLGSDIPCGMHVWARRFAGGARVSIWFLGLPPRLFGGGGRSLRSIRTSPGELTRPLGAGPPLPIARWPRAPGCVRVGTATLGKATITKGDLSEIRVSEVPGESCSGHHDYCTGTRAVGQPCL